MKVNNSKEEWRPVKLRGYTKLYEVSSDGRVRSVDRAVKRTRIRKDWSVVDNHTAHYKSRELKPYIVTKKRGAKYHLHKRVKQGARGQTDVYVYGKDLAIKAFPELYETF